MQTHINICMQQKCFLFFFINHNNLSNQFSMILLRITRLCVNGPSKLGIDFIFEASCKDFRDLRFMYLLFLCSLFKIQAIFCLPHERHSSTYFFQSLTSKITLIDSKTKFKLIYVIHTRLYINRILEALEAYYNIFNTFNCILVLL